MSRVQERMEAFEHWLGRQFSKWGRFVARKPLCVIISAFIIGLAMSGCAMFVKNEEDNVLLYAPQVSPPSFSPRLEKAHRLQSNTERRT